MKGYIRLAGKVLFDDEHALKLKPGFVTGGHGGNASPVSRVGTRAGCGPNEPAVYVARCGRSDFCGFVSGVWFEDGEAVVNAREAAVLGLGGCTVEQVA